MPRSLAVRCAGVVLVTMVWSGGEWSRLGYAETQATGMTPLERQQRERELRREVTRIQDELRALNREPTGVTISGVPRSELADQPTRTLRESLESVPGVSARQGQGGRDLTLSIRGSRK